MLKQVIVIALLITTALPLQAKQLYEYLWASVLKENTKQYQRNQIKYTAVDYESLQNSQSFRTLVRGLSKFKIENLSTKEEEISFWINMYNIAAINIVHQHYPVESIKKIGTVFQPVWNQPALLINKRQYSLHEIHHEILTPYNDLRIHLALSCAAISCPDLRQTPYTSLELNKQLTEQTENFIKNKTKGVDIDRSLEIINVATLFKWHQKEFQKDAGIKAFLKPYIKENIKAHTIRYLPQDWDINGF